MWDDELARAVRRARKATEALGGSPGLSLPPRPKGRHLRTHEVLLLNALVAELAVDQESTKKIETLLRRVENHKRKHGSSLSNPTQAD